MTVSDYTPEEIDGFMLHAWEAFHQYRKLSLQSRAGFMRAIAREIDHYRDTLIEVAMKETNLPLNRLRSELDRTMFQLTSYSDFCESGQWLDARIDTGDDNRTPPKPDIRKMLVPLGPVVVFGAGNFPFAYSTAGGDTACALAAGCPVIVKAHPAHAKTSDLVASAILKAAAKVNMPKGVFTHVQGNSFKTGEILVKHPYTKAVGFTGSFAGGKQLFDWGSQRRIPIPVFAEMSSENPVFLLPGKMKTEATAIAKMYAASITLSVGQYCTNPGIIIGIDNDDLKTFIRILSDEIKNTVPAPMLNDGIYKNYSEKRATALAQDEVDIISVSEAKPVSALDGIPTLANTSAANFISNQLLRQEVFGPFTIIVICNDTHEMLEVTKHLEGQLTCTLMATTEDILQNELLVEAVKNICGRFILNGVPTGVEVGLSMQHGGPYPATTDSRFTSVGGDGIRRFARPLAFQNWDNNLLPNELKNENPLGIFRTVNNELKR